MLPLLYSVNLPYFFAMGIIFDRCAKASEEIKLFEIKQKRASMWARLECSHLERYAESMLRKDQQE